MPKCTHGRVEEDESGGVRFLAGRFADAYLQKRSPQPGYTIVGCHGRHVADLTEFTEAESIGFWHDSSPRPVPSMKCSGPVT